MDNREVAGVRRAIDWLHKRAKEMNDPHATMILNNAGFHLGVELRKWRGSEEPIHCISISGTVPITVTRDE